MMTGMKTYLYAAAGALLYTGVLISPAYAQAIHSAIGVTGSTSLSVPQLESSIASDTAARNVSVSSTSVGMTYPIKAKLFGVLPATLTASVEVQSNGKVAVHYPWYAFLFSTDQAELQTKLEAVGQAASTWGAASLDSTEQLALLSLVHAALQSTLESSTSASTQLH